MSRWSVVGAPVVHDHLVTKPLVIGIGEGNRGSTEMYIPQSYGQTLGTRVSWDEHSSMSGTTTQVS